MEKVIHRAEDRGKGEHGWLSTRFSFSFADWYEPTRMGFGALRVINDDRIAAGKGFGAHGHKDMEIITIVTSGVVAHKDSMGNEGRVSAGEVQVMSAGTGVMHAEFNGSQTDPLTLFQIWIEPNKRGAVPRYAQKTFSTQDAVNGMTLLVGPDGSGGLPIHQDAYITEVKADEGETKTYDMKREGNGAYVFVVQGVIRLDGITLNERDALGVTDITKLDMDIVKSGVILIIEVPVAW